MRKCTPLYLSKSGLLTALIAAIFTPHAFAAPAGRVDFVQGSVSATGSGGSARKLTKGDDINSGDIITIGDGRAQIRFSDGAYLALQPNTVFKVDEYAFDGKADGSEKGFFSLVKGGLRTISGLIGKSNRQSYKLSTPNATIGIRGTAFSANQTDDRLIVTTHQGRVSVTNPMGSVTIGSGQSVIVPSLNSSPRMTNEQAPSSQVPAQQQEQQQEQQQGQQQQPASPPLVSGNQLTSSGTSQTATSASLLTTTTTTTTTIPLPPPPPVLTSGPGFSIAYGSPSSLYAEKSINATFDAGQTLKSFNNANGTLDFTFGAAQESGGDGIIGWGRWIGPVTATGSVSESGSFGANDGIHYVVGQPTLKSSLNLGSNATVSYSLVGATKPSTFNGSYTLGTFSGSATVVFSAVPTLTLNANVATSLGTYSLGTMGALPLTMPGPTSEFTTSGIYGASASVSIKGLFAGSTGERLGIAYQIFDIGNTTGAAAFRTP